METLLSVATLAAFGWIVAFLIPKARREHERFALICAALSALVTLVGFWLFARGVR